jgi:hypothetical protein
MGAMIRRGCQTWPKAGADVIIAIFGDFCQFSAKKLAFFPKTNIMIKV